MSSLPDAHAPGIKPEDQPRPPLTEGSVASIRYLSTALADLQARKDAAEQALGEHHGKRIDEVISRYAAACYAPHDGPGTKASIKWTIGVSHVCVHWDENWAYGGHDDGSFDIPISYLWDEDELKLYEAHRAAEKQEAREQEKAAELARKQRELAQLQKELGVTP